MILWNSDVRAKTKISAVLDPGDNPKFYIFKY